MVSLHIITSSVEHGEYREQQRSTPSRSFFKFAEKGARAGFNLSGQRIKLQGQIESFDQYVVLLRNTVTQMVYKHAISTIVPGRAVNFSGSELAEQSATPDA